jgi:ferredoxin--NADP+ reductase
LASPVAFLGDHRVEGLSLVQNSTGDGGGLIRGDPAKDSASIETSLVFRAIGFRGSAINGLPYDAGTGVIPYDRGRLIDDNHAPIVGVYVTGWIKRGPDGVIGTNRTCAQETVTALLADFDNGVLGRPVGGRDDLLAAMTQRNADPVTWAGWRD